MDDPSKLSLPQLRKILIETYGYRGVDLVGQPREYLEQMLIDAQSKTKPMNFNTRNYHSRSSARSVNYHHGRHDYNDNESHNDRLYTLTGAIVHDDVNKVKQLVDEGSDINDVLLISHKFNKHHISKYARDNGADADLDW